jgi:hypothetical protein
MKFSDLGLKNDRFSSTFTFKNNPKHRIIRSVQFISVFVSWAKFVFFEFEAKFDIKKVKNFAHENGDKLNTL